MQIRPVSKDKVEPPVSEEKAETTTAPEEEAVVDSTDIPEHFKNSDGSLNAAAIIKSQADGQAEITRLKQGVDTAEPVAAPDQPAVELTGTSPVIIAANDEYAKDGKLSNDTYEALASAGMNRALVDTYIAGQIANVAAGQAEMVSITGGQENWDAMLEWGHENLTEQEKTDFDSNLQSPASARAAASGLYARFTAESEVIPSPIDGVARPTASGDFFRSSAEMTEALSNPKYTKDSAYRADCQRRIQAANRAGVNLGIGRRLK